MGSIIKDKPLRGIAVIFIFIVFFLAPAGSAVAAPPSEASHRETALELVEIVTKNIYDETLSLLENMIQQQLAEEFKDLPPEKRAAADAVQSETIEWLREFFSWERIRELYAGIYMEVFTEEEMRELIAFYQTPLGQKVLAKTPELVEKSFEKTQALLSQEIPKLQERLERKIKEFEE